MKFPPIWLDQTITLRCYWIVGSVWLSLIHSCISFTFMSSFELFSFGPFVFVFFFFSFCFWLNHFGFFFFFFFLFLLFLFGWIVSIKCRFPVKEGEMLIYYFFWRWRWGIGSIPPLKLVGFHSVRVPVALSLVYFSYVLQAFKDSLESPAGCLEMLQSRGEAEEEPRRSNRRIHMALAKTPCWASSRISRQSFQTSVKNQQKQTLRTRTHQSEIQMGHEKGKIKTAVRCRFDWNLNPIETK